MKRTIRKGRIVLAAATAATLSACGDDGSSGDSDSDSSSSSSTTATTTTTTTTSGTTSTSTDTTTSSSTDATASSSSTTTDATSGTEGTGSTGGTEGTGSTGGTTGGMAQSLTPEEVCPFPLNLYETGEYVVETQTPDQSVFAGPQQTAEVSGLVLWEGTAGDDQINVETFFGNALPCIVAGDGDDLIEFEYGETGEGVALTTISTGTGQDTIAFRTGNAFPPFGADVPVATIVDFEPGQDRIFLDTADIQGFDPEEGTVDVVVGSYDGSTIPVNPTVYIDNDDGEIWLAEPGETFESVMQLAQIVGDVDLAAEDIIVGDTMPGCPFNISSAGNSDFRPFTSGEAVGDIFTGEAGTPFTSNSVVQGSRENDRLSSSTAFGGGTVCIAGGDGDDELTAVVGFPGESQSSVLIGGAGADRFGLNHDYIGAGGTTTTRISDFEPGVDTIVFNSAGFTAGELGESVMFIDNFDGSTFPAPIVIDNVDGEIWHTDQEGSSRLAATLDGAPDLDVNDLEFISAPVP